MKILHINKFLTLHGGAEFYLQGLMKRQREAGHEVHVFSTKHSDNLPSDDEKYFVERFDLSKRESFWHDVRKAKNFLWNGEARFALSHMLEDVRPDVVHIHNAYHHLSSSILTAIRLANIPCVQTLHDYHLVSPNYSLFAHGGVCEHGKGGHYFETIKHRCVWGQFVPSALAAVEMWMTKQRQSYERTVNLFLCPSHFMQETMEEWGEPKDQLCYVPNPTDLPEQMAIRGGGYVLYAGRLSPEKGLESFIQATAQIPRLTVKIAGRGPEEKKLKDLVVRLGAKHIEFVGFQTPAQLATLRHHAEAVVLPTLSYENASGSLLEAMASGLPCLATRIGGNPELIEDGVNGFLVTPGSVSEWMNAFERFATLSNADRERFGQAGRARIMKNHTWGQHAERVMECYTISMASPNEKKR